MKRLAIILVLVLLINNVNTYAEDIISPEQDFYYFDEVGILSNELKGEIFFSNKLLCDDCGAQIVVAVINTTGIYNTEEYCIKLFNKWGIGDAQKNNGFLLLLAIQDDDYYACPGEGLEKLFPASRVKDMFDLYLENDFAAKKYEDGVKKFYEAVFNYIAKAYHSNVSIQDGINEYKAYEDKKADKSIDLTEMSWEDLVILQQQIQDEMQHRAESAKGLR